MRVFLQMIALSLYGPSSVEKGAVHLTTAAIVNALWDLWGKIENKPVWRVLCDLSPEEIASLVDFTHISDELTCEEAI